MKPTGMEDNSEAKPLAQIERHSYSEVGWISRQNLLALRSRQNFFLDIPFYRTFLHDENGGLPREGNSVRRITLTCP